MVSIVDFEEDVQRNGNLSMDQAMEILESEDRRDSMADVVSLLNVEDRAKLLEGVDMERLQYDWNFWGRKPQIVEDEPYSNIHLALSARGWGKSRFLTEHARKKAMEKPGTRIIALGRTAQDTRDVLVSGDSGILNIPQPEDEKPHYKVNEGVVVWKNGSTMLLRSAERPDGVRGIQAEVGIVDELASHSPWVGADGLTAFQNLRLAVRLGDHPHLLIATTPKRTQVIRDLVAEAEEKGPRFVRLIRGTTMENRALSSAYMEVLKGTHEGDPLLWRQEILGELLDDDLEGVLLTPDDIHIFPMEESAKTRFNVRVVGVDPSVAQDPRDLCGIVVAGMMTGAPPHKRKAYILEDASIKASPEVWAKRVVEVAHKWNVHGVVVEKNQGDHLVTMALKAIDPTLRIFPVHAGVSKATRAEPVATRYRQKKVIHTESFPELESEWTTWLPAETKKSPDRLDACVWAVHALLLNPPKGLLRNPVSFVPPRGGLPIGGLGTGAARSWGGSR